MVNNDLDVCFRLGTVDGEAISKHDQSCTCTNLDINVFSNNKMWLNCVKR